MNNQTKRGFSLVEVMILFTVLAVAMAASLPLITKKSKPVPTKISHGVYRCIAQGNGFYLEETYNSFRQLKSNPRATACHFNKVPNASVYKIDLYSAGAGGTKYAAYVSANDDHRSSTFTMADAVTYAKTGNLTFSNKQGAGNGDMPYDFTDDNIRLALQNEQVILSAFSGNGGRGGDATYTYKSPARMICSAFVHGADNAIKLANEAKGKWDSAKNRYIEKNNDYDAQIDKLKEPLPGYEAKIKDNNALVKQYETHIETLENYANAMNNLSSLYSTLASATTVDARIAAYSNLRAAASKNATNYGIYNVYQTSPMSYTAYHNIVDPLSSVNKNMSDVDVWLKNENNHKRNVYDEEDKTKIIGTRNATDAEKMEDLLGSTSSMGTLQGMSTPGESSAYYATSYISNLNGYISNLNEDTKNQKKNIEDIEKQVAAKEKERQNDEELNNLNNVEIPKLQKDYNTRQDVYNAMRNDTKGINPRPRIYNDRFDLRLDSDNQYVTPETLKQMDDYCKNAEETKLTHEFYTDQTYNWDGSLGIEPYTADDDSVTQSGGAGGSGKYMKLVYNLFYRPGFHPANLARSYAYVNYIGELYGNVNNLGYGTETCTSLTLDSSTCSPGTVSNAESGKSGTNNQLTWEKIGSTHIGRAENGKNVEKFMAFHNDPKASRYSKQYATVQKKTTNINGKDVGATGGKGGAVGYIESNKTHVTGNYTENLAWQTFKGEGSSYGVHTATKGLDAVVSQGTYATPDSLMPGITGYHIGVASRMEAQEPRIDQSSNTWTKSYSVGQAGSPGRHSHFQVASMGDHCSISIPHGGDIFDYMALKKEAENKGLNATSYLNTKKQEYESSLDASITCYDKEGLVVFDRNLKGGQYNITPTGWSNPFYWRKNVSSHSTTASDPASAPVAAVPRWAKVFHRAMSSLGNVASGGSGTGLTDYCVAPKGDYHFAAYRLHSVNGGPWTETLIGTPFDKSYDGKKDNLDCYKSDKGEGDYTGPRIFDNSNDGNMTDAEKRNYSISSPSPGGGGAIVIMW